jgi:hypothetical protein
MAHSVQSGFATSNRRIAMKKTTQKAKPTSQEKQEQKFQELKKSILRDVTGGLRTASCGDTQPP